MYCYYLEVVVNLNGHCKGCSGPITSHFSVALDRKEEGGPLQTGDNLGRL